MFTCKHHLRLSRGRTPPEFATSANILPEKNHRILQVSSLPPADQLAFLDACHDAGFKVMYDLGTGPVDVNRGGPFDVPALLDDLRRNASLVARHPALVFLRCAPAFPTHGQQRRQRFPR